MPPPQVPTTLPSPSLPLSTMVKVGLTPPLASIFLAISSLSSSQDLGPDCAERVSDAQKRTAAVMRSFMGELAFCSQGLRTMIGNSIRGKSAWRGLFLDETLRECTSKKWESPTLIYVGYMVSSLYGYECGD